jgi:hypothetical protein
MCEIVTQQQGGKQRKRLYQVQSTVLCSVCGLGNKVTFYHDEPDQDTVLY